MKILFISPLGKETSLQNWASPSLGIRRMVSYLRRKRPQHRYYIYDNQIHTEDPIESYRNANIEVLGVSLLHDTLIDSIAFIRKWKEAHPDCLIVVGNAEATENYQDVLEHAPVDIIVMGEGEDRMLKILDWKEGNARLEEIDGIIFRKYAKAPTQEEYWDYWESVHFDEFEYPAYWKEMQKHYHDPNLEFIPAIRIVTGTHCLRACTYCSVALVRNYASGKITKPVLLSGEELITIVKRAAEEVPQCKRIYFVSDDILFYKPPFIHFLNWFKDSGLPHKIMIQTHSANLTKDIFELLAKARCDQISIGIENASAYIRKTLMKPQGEQHIEDIITWSKESGVPVYFLILLFPPESRLEDCWINYITLSRWLDAGVQISIEPVIYAYRGAPLWKDEGKYRFMYEKVSIGRNEFIKNPLWIEPRLPEVAKLVHEFVDRVPEFIKEEQKKLDHTHLYKGARGPMYVKLLGQMLKEIDPNEEYNPLRKD